MNAQTILSTKLTSKNQAQAMRAGFIDKLEFSLKDINLTREDIINEFQANEIKHEEGSFRNRQCYIKAFMPNSVIYLVYSWSSKKVYKAITKPSDFESYQDFIKEFTNTLGGQKTIEELPITRIDKTIDIALSLIEIERGLIVKFKRAMGLFSYESGGSTGLQIGKNDEVIKVYSRTKKAKLNYPCSRIEIMNKGSKIQFKTLRELRSFWSEKNGLVDQSFKHIQLNDVLFKQVNQSRRDQLYYLVSTFPYMLVRARLNDNGNFNRDYKKVHNLRAWELQPTEIFNTGMRIFFKNDENKVEL